MNERLPYKEDNLPFIPKLLQPPRITYLFQINNR